MNKKDRRHSGRYFPAIVGKEKLCWLRENCLLPKEEWDDWKDYRDGLRHNKDRSQIRSPFMSLADPQVIRKQNAKLKKLEERRKCKKKLKQF